MTKNPFILLAVLLTLAATGIALVAQAPTPSLTDDKLAGFTYRSLGPYRAGSWVSDIAVPDTPQKSHLYMEDPYRIYGGLQVHVLPDPGVGAVFERRPNS